MYAYMLLQVDVSRRETVAEILQRVVMVVRPLTLSEFSAATEKFPRPSVGLSSDEVVRDQVTFYRYFPMVTEDEVGLIHLSAKDYLLRITINSSHELEFFHIGKEKINL